MRHKILALSLVVLLAGCQANQFGAREKGALTGGAIGAGLGAIVGNQVGSPGAGVAIGSAFGALSGAFIGNEMDNQDAALAERERKLDEQDKEINENRRLLEELRNNGVDAKVTDRGLVMNIPDVLFEFDSSRLSRGALRTVEEIARVVNRSAGRRVSVEGHTDSVGSDRYNQELSERRARSVAAELNASGVSRSRIRSKGFGESRPIATNSSDSGRQRNRRVEVILEN